MLSGTSTATVPLPSPGLSGLAARYDAFIVDQWGVLHGGEAPYPGAIDCLSALKAAGKRVIILTNSGKRAAVNVGVLAAIGIGGQHIDAIHSSGEEAWRALRERAGTALRDLGRRCLFLARGDNSGILEGLDLVPTASPEEAEFVFNTGVDPAAMRWEDYTALLAPAVARKLPMVCANPDVTAPLGRRIVFGAGALADWYRSRGCPVIRFGKPDKAVFDACLKLAGNPDRGRVLVVGDSLGHDVRGAMNAGLDSAFIAGGIHAEALRIRRGETPSIDAVARLARAFAVQPVHVLPVFAW